MARFINMELVAKIGDEVGVSADYIQGIIARYYLGEESLAEHMLRECLSDHKTLNAFGFAAFTRNDFPIPKDLIDVVSKAADKIKIPLSHISNGYSDTGARLLTAYQAVFDHSMASRRGFFGYYTAEVNRCLFACIGTNRLSGFELAVNLYLQMPSTEKQLGLSTVLARSFLSDLRKAESFKGYWSENENGVQYHLPEFKNAK